MATLPPVLPPFLPDQLIALTGAREEALADVYHLTGLDVIDRDAFMAIPEAMRVVHSEMVILQGYEPRVERRYFTDALRELDEMKKWLQAIARRGPTAVESTTLPLVRTTAGRLKYDISPQRLAQWVQEGFTNHQIALFTGVSSMTIMRRRKEYETPARITDISDADLEQRIRWLKENGSGFTGALGIAGILKSEGIVVPRQRLRSLLKAVDPQGTVDRWARRIVRRNYSVPFPMSLWHLDGNHKLSRWGFVIHGCIDGYSRMITFLRVSRDNRASTVLEYFEEAVNLFGWPSRVRSDYGGKNVGVKRLMEEARGRHRGSHIMGTSTRNQRIERLWRDLRAWQIEAIRDVFYDLENQQLLVHRNPIHQYLLHLAFGAYIHEAVQRFVQGWNHHTLKRPKGQMRDQGQTPRAMFILGRARAEKAGFSFALSDEQALEDLDVDGVNAELDFAGYGDDDDDDQGRDRERGDQHALVTEVDDHVLDEEAKAALFEEIRVQGLESDTLELKEARRKYLVLLRWAEENLAM
ncbi:BZ3500_MvSof-1268-A1-R1_Chr2-3g05391 [Microbotryum saponariae]|uniref:BZ3500_MvSof-1268-A1-R1_Chr2-3g05391 protein n=1 Tax=Microbotryum saponariae TaxID=289078 RepID=A0A2X0L9G7_9BASI|nr:BZ3500_MvSof-1268-A1-R1_Chr2-3g05391 [Microbotryum saponariae]SDA01348.1 BZ3501_MvSof-1269-A2-R1_Chr2-2g05064 [Microbotryum saponariae]